MLPASMAIDDVEHFDILADSRLQGISHTGFQAAGLAGFIFAVLIPPGEPVSGSVSRSQQK